MYLPAATVATAMATDSTTEGRGLSLHPQVSSSTHHSISIKWACEGDSRGFRVQYNRDASAYRIDSGMLAYTAREYYINNLVSDTYYRICVTMFHGNESYPLEECLEASTTSWHIPVSIGSSIGAVLALSIIVLIVLLSRCPNLVRQPRTAAAESSKYDSMSSHFPDDRYEMSDTTTHCHDREDDVFSQNSEGDSLAESKGPSRHAYQHSPQSLAERVCNGSKISNGGSKPARANIPLGRCGRTLSLTERRHNPSHPYRSRQARLAHMHTHFHSIQSEPGGHRTAPRISISDFPASAVSAELSASRKSHHSSMPTTHNGKGSLGHTAGAYAKLTNHTTNSESATSTSEPTVAESNPTKVRPPVLKYVSKTLHMSIEGDTLV